MRLATSAAPCSGVRLRELLPTIQVNHLPLLLRPKQTCELFGINSKALHKLETSGRVMMKLMFLM